MADNTKVYNIKIDGIEENVNGVKSLKDQTNDYAKAVRETNKEIKSLQGQMLGLDKGSSQWKALAKEAGDLKDKVNDAREAINRYASDTKALDDVINVAQSATAAFTLAKGAMSAFGLETESAVKAIQQLQGAMAIIQSLQALQNTLKGSSATATLLTKSMNLLSFGIKGTTTATKALRVAMMSIGIGLVITAVSVLVEHWEDLVGWLNKTFPVLNKIGGVMNGLKGILRGVGEAILHWFVNPWKTAADVMKKLFSGDFEGALKAAQEGIKRQFQGTADAFKNGFQKQVENGLEEITLKSIEEDNKQTKHHLEMLKAKKGNEAKYSKEGIALQKKDFEQRKKLAKGNKDELNKIAVEEANFYRECQEHKSAAAKKAAADAEKAAKKRADAEKKAAEEAKQALEKTVKAEVYVQKSLIAYKIESAKYDIEAAKKNVERYSAGPIEKYLEALDDLNESEKELLNLEEELRQYDMFAEFRDSINPAVTSFTEFNDAVKEAGDNISKLFQDGVKIGDVDKVTSEAIAKVKLFSKLSKDELKTLYGFILKNDKELINSNKVTQENITEVQKNALKKEEEGIEKTTLKYELSEDKKSEATQALVQKLNVQWDNYLEHVKQVYGEDSKEYLEAQKKKQQATIGDDGKKKYGNQFMDFDANGGVDWGGIKKTIEDAYDAYAAPIVEGLGDTIHMMMEFAIEEAQDALDEATEVHDKAVEKVEKSKSRLTEINQEMQDASATRLEKLKEQQADEMLLLAQREAEEKRAEREKERKEQELERKKKRQRKLELQVQMVEALASGALAAINGFATKPFVPVGLAMGALATTLTAIQLGVMAKQMSKLADGGLLSGPSHSKGGIPVGMTGIEVEGGEYVVNKRSTAKFLPLLQQINEEGARKKTVANQIGKMANGGQLNYNRVSSSLSTQDIAKVIQTSVGAIDMHPTVSVVDINREQKNLTTVRQMAGTN